MEEKNITVMNSPPKQSRVKSLVLAIAWIVMFMFVQGIGSAIYMTWYQISHMDAITSSITLDDLMQNTELITGITLWGTIVSLFVMMFIWWCMYDSNLKRGKVKPGFLQYNGLKQEHIITKFNYFAVGFALSYLSVIILSFLSIFLSEEAMASTTDGVGVSPLGFFSIAICAPIVEEIVYRHYVFNALKKSYSFAVANFMQALLFGFSHGVSMQTCYTFLIALYMGHLVQKRKSIVPTIMLHIGLNCTAGLLLTFENLYNTPVFYAVQCALVLYGMIIVNKPELNWDVDESKEKEGVKSV